jgi:threonine aldolase
MRKALGGGMRQAGIIAAAGIVALHTMIDRMAEDHLNARVLAEGLSPVAGIEVRPVKRRTNMVVFEVAGNAQAAAAFAVSLKQRGVLVGARGPTAFRAVTHYGISRGDINRAVVVASEAAAEALSDQARG